MSWRILTPSKALMMIYKTNSAWFHCSFEINIEDPTKISFIPIGYTLDRIQSNGWAWMKKEGSTNGWTQKDIFLYGEQVCEYIQEGKSVYVKGHIDRGDRPHDRKNPIKFSEKLNRMVSIGYYWKIPP